MKDQKPTDADWIALIALAAHDLTALLLGRPDDVLAQKPDPATLAADPPSRAFGERRA